MQTSQPQTFRDCATCPEMVTIPKGSYEMGPAPGEEQREGVPVANRQSLQRRITIDYSFALGKYEVTRGEFAAFEAAMTTHITNSGVVYAKALKMD